MRYTLNLAIRVGLAFLLGIFFEIYYVIFKPITLFLSFFILKIVNNSAILWQDKIYTATHSLTFIDACTAAAAYFLLTLLVLLTKDLLFWKRIAMIIYGSSLILVFNIIRIELLFYFLFNHSYELFEIIHITFWKFLSTIYVFLVWIYLVKIFHVKSIPGYSDIKYLIKEIKKKQK